MKKRLIISTVILSILFCISIANAEDKCESVQKSLNQMEHLLNSGNRPNETPQEKDANIQAAAQQWRETIALLGETDLDMLESFAGWLSYMDKAFIAVKDRNNQLRDINTQVAKKRYLEMKNKCQTLRFLGK